MTMRGTNGLGVALVCCCPALLGACTTPDDDPAASSAMPSAILGSDGQDLQRALLTPEDIASAIGASATGIGQMTGGQATEVSRIMGVEGCSQPRSSSGTSGPSAVWKAGVFYTFQDGDLGTDVIECISLAQPMTYELIRDAVGGPTYDPAPIGTRAIAIEKDGGGGAIDRVAVVEDEGVVVVVAANRHSPVPEGSNLTRAQVDQLVAIALGNLAAERSGWFMKGCDSSQSWPRTWHGPAPTAAGWTCSRF